MAEERVRTRNSHGKKNGHLISGSLSNGGGGGNGIAGLVVFGGALAVAGFIAVASFATNKNKKTKGPLTKPNPQPQQLSLDNDCKSQEDHEIETTQGLRSLLQHSSTPTNEADACQGTTITRSISHTSILEEKIDPVPELNTTNEGEVLSPTCFHFHHQEIVLSDDSHPESAASSNNSGIEEDCLTSLIDSQTLHVESQESLKSLETEPHDGVISENGKQQEEDSSKVSESAKEEVNSETILNSNVRPAEQDFKGEGGGIDIQSEEAHGVAKTDTDAGAVTVTPEATSNEKGNFSVVLNDQPSALLDLVQLTTWLMPMLLLALLLVLLLVCLSIADNNLFL